MITTVAVVVPARDEQDTIAACLDALGVARARLQASDPSVDVRIVVVLDDCRDGTAAVVDGYRDVETVVSSAGCVGSARRQGTAALLASLDRPLPEIWLASTDADSLVPPDWLARMVGHGDAGAELVLGTVRPGAGLTGVVAAAWRAVHDATDGHPHVHAANLGISAATYRALGGWRDLPGHEDVDLVERAMLGGHRRIDRVGDIAVTTSSRLVGRVPVGFATYLQALDITSSGLGAAAPQTG